ncbi:hypothetical protein F5Y18DRAFT_15225 [Xylariaceae sp. FL1019]|nr:hypothetical protein F5Y18DRAFT_15225 [Xylariaceae sp. FL1019]
MAVPTAMDFDVVIVGAGISGINAAYRVQAEAGMKYALLESRESIGGTWDLFRYPGIRSDSDVYTLGFSWSPWTLPSQLASGEEIRNYLDQSVKSAGIDEHIYYRHAVQTANWSSTERAWTLSVSVPGEEKPLVFRSRLLFLGTGYYDYTTPLQAVIPGIEDFKGKVIHPQFWPEDFDYTDKEVVIIGSGATAVTILPAIADRAKRATMLQRSPGYIFSIHSQNALARLLFAVLPAALAHWLNRLIWIFRAYLAVAFCKGYPEVAKRFVRHKTIQQLPPDIKWDPNFKPNYDPWEQRFCACMDGDFFAALRSGKADVVTDKIKTVTSTSIELSSGGALHPDVIVTATGLKLKFGGGIQFAIDGQHLEISEKFAWRAAMVQDVPNMFFLTGYENATWTLGADVVVTLFLRLLPFMGQRKAKVVIPKLNDSDFGMEERPMMNLSSTYVRTAGKVFPKGGRGSWSPKKNYLADVAAAKFGNITKDLVFI